MRQINRSIQTMLVLLFAFGQMAIAQPVNDNCSTAISLGTLPIPAACTGATGTNVGNRVTLTGQTTIGATASNPYPYDFNCAVNLANPPHDVWYSFVASGFQATIIVSSATFANPMITIWTGSCGSMSSLGCMTGASGTDSLTVFQLTIGATYYVQVAGEDSAQNGTFTLSAHNDNVCSTCLVSSTVAASPAPVNGTYAPGQTVNFCFTVTNWQQIDDNWFHGVQPSFGSGWDTTTFTVTSIPSSCDGEGTWGWYPTGVTSTATGVSYPRGFYYASQEGPGAGAGGPGNNYGDDCTSNTWTFCMSVTAKQNIGPGSDLGALFGTTADGESGGWSSTGCGNDLPGYFNATGRSCGTGQRDSISYVHNAGGQYQFTGSSQGFSQPSYYWYINGAFVSNTNPVSYALSVDSHTVIVLEALDSGSCPSYDTISITTPACSLLAYMSSSAIGADDVLSIPYIYNGTSPYTYHWSNSATGALDTVQYSGIYFCTVTDYNGCTAHPGDTVTGLACTATVAISYQALGGGQYRFTASDSGFYMPAYRWFTGSGYFLSGSSTTATFTPGIHGVSLGLYDSVTHCVAFDTITINVPVCGLAGHVTNVNFPVYNEDALAAIINGGSGRYSYLWSANAGSSLMDSVFVSFNGIYAVTVTDSANGCQLILSDTVANLCGVQDSITYQFLGNGQVLFTAHGSGAAHIMYEWGLPNWINPIMTSSNTYIYTFTAGPHGIGINTWDSATSCVIYDSINFVVPAYGCTLAGSISQHQVGNNEEITASPLGGISPYTYNWSFNTLFNYGASAYVGNNGVYQVTVTDSIGCTLVLTDTVTGLPCAVQDSFTYQALGGGWYHFTAYTTGSVFPLYQWHYSGGGGEHSMGILQSFDDSLPSGPVTVVLVVTDSVTGCNNYDSLAIYVMAGGCTLSGTLTQLSVTGPAVQLTANISGGSGNYQYNWSPNTNTADVYFSTEYNNGVYWVSVTDTAGCSLLLIDTVSSLSCNAQVSITYASLGGNEYVFFGHSSGLNNPQYAWVSGSNILGTNDSLHYSFPSGSTQPIVLWTYDSITGCQNYDSISITVPVYTCNFAPGSISQQSISGAVVLIAIPGIGGTAPYSYNWSLGSSGASDTIAYSGIYSCTITDYNGCTAMATVNVTTLPCNAHVSISYQVLGPGQYLLIAHYSGFTAPKFEWNPGGGGYVYAGDSIINGVAPGVLGASLNVWDSVSPFCSAFDSISFPSCSLTGSLTQQAASGDVQLTANVSGGSGNYQYFWSANTNTADVNFSTEFNNGIYTVTVVDTTGCSIELSDTISSLSCSAQVSITYNYLGSGNYVFYGQTTGLSNPQYRWTSLYAQLGDSDSLYYNFPLGSSQSVIFTAYDSINSCSNYDSIGFIVPGTGCSLAGSIAQQTISGNTVLIANITGGVQPYNYYWSNGFSGDTAVVSTSGYYCVTVSDNSGCSAVFCDSVTSGSGCSAQFTYQDSCGTIILQPATWYVSAFLWAFGDGTNASYAGAGAIDIIDHNYAQPGTYTVTLYIQSTSGCIDSFSAQVYAANIGCTATDTICGTVFSDLNGNGIQDSGEAGLGGQQINAGGYTAYTDSFGHYLIALPAGIYDITYINVNGYTLTIPVGADPGAYDSVSISGGYTHCGFNFGVIDSGVTISGYVYLSAYGNGAQNVPVYIGSNVVFTDYYGYFVWTGPAGSYTVSYTPSGPYSSYTSSPASYPVNAVNGGVYSGNDFALSQSGSACNIATTLIANTTVTPGYPAWYDVYVINYGANVASGTMTFYYDPALMFNYASVTQTSINTGTHSIVFDYSGLQPGQYEDITLFFTANTNDTIGQPTFELATATDNCIESNYNDNTDTVHQNATGSWDPNMKVVTPSGSGPQGLILPTQPLRYTLAFQNTGTAPAVNVVLHDAIPASLDISTLRVIGASHPDYAVQIDGRTLICRFSQIMLPDSAANPEGSHGYLSFDIEPEAGIANGTQIQNTASIFFDYNAGVSTNTTLNTIDNTLSITEIQDHVTITVSPNPFRDFTTISVSGIETAGASLEVFDMVGQQVSVIAPSSDGVFTLSASNLSSGVYIYVIKESGHTIGSGKLVVEE